MNPLILLKKITQFSQRFFLAIFIACVLYFTYLIVGSSIPNYSSNLLSAATEPSAKFNVTSADTTSTIVKNSKPSQSLNFSLVNYDHRARVFDLYFLKNNSPLYGYGSAFISACDKYRAPRDCTLLPAIAKVETNLCKTAGSLSQHNCWGYGGSAENRIKYKNFDLAIDAITGKLISGYGKDFFNDPEIGELYYCGPHCNTWGDKVKIYQDEIKNFSKTV